MTEEEYRWAGKLHKYDPDTDTETEWQKRYSRVAKNVDELMKILEEDEQDPAIGLAGCADIIEKLKMTVG
ncbi:hypothetical protein BAE44_0000955 [Dichanthelium oligosanthes]|uniref:Uncharacterized protein n=1 Tax=Dichanthelium oligosanthes TaxID=888268 RepID=A0A1E5WL08_9POAL|nr:hypothetical protein BAE44_0000955 [Dichanthelium oligosanthes]